MMARPFDDITTTTTTPTAARIAVITDVHGNRPALQAALAAIETLGCDRIVHVGDAIGIGPFPAETLALLLADPRLRFVMGNHDAWYVHGLPEPRPAWMSAGEWDHHGWTHAALDAADPAFRDAMRAWPWQLDDEIAGVCIRWQHYGLAGDGGPFVPIVHDPGPEALDRIFGMPGHLGAPDVLFFGHHHPAMDRVGTSGVRYLNPGALGTGGEGVARFAVLDIADDGRWTVTPHAVTYDPEPVIRAFGERKVPDRDLILTAFFGR
jgi:predicted phosphodiesterase